MEKNNMQTRNEYESTLKSADTEEWTDVHFYRPAGYRWALLFRRLGVHPNVVTILSIFLFVTSSILFAFPDLKLNIVGMVFLVWGNMYDSADGQLARLTGQKTTLGRILDGFAGTVWAISLYIGLCLRMYPQFGWWIFLLGIWAGAICHAKQCRLADYYRNIHLFFLKGKKGSELDNIRQQEEVYRSLSWKHNFVQKLFQFFYVRYVRAQEHTTPSFQQFIREVNRRFPSTVPQQLRDDFRRGSLPLMKYTNLLTFNLRSFVLCLSLLAGIPLIYMIFEITVMEIMFYYMRYRHEKLCQSLSCKLSQYEK